MRTIGPFPMPGGIVPVDVETTSELVREVQRLNQSNKELLAALRRASLALSYAADSSDAMRDDYRAVCAAIEKATKP